MNFWNWLNQHFNLLRNIPILFRMNKIEDWERNKFVEKQIKQNELQLIFNECDKRLAETVKSKELFYQRSVTLLTISITLLVSSIGYLSSRMGDFYFGVLNVTLIVSIFILWYICGTLKVNLNPVVFHVNGTLPDHLFNTKYFTEYEGEGKTSQERMLLDLIIAYRQKVHENVNINTLISERYGNAINALYALPCFVLLICVLAYIFKLPF